LPDAYALLVAPYDGEKSVSRVEVCLVYAIFFGDQMPVARMYSGRHDNE
jgi:hypothetical protein